MAGSRHDLLDDPRGSWLSGRLSASARRLAWGRKLTATCRQLCQLPASRYRPADDLIWLKAAAAARAIVSSRSAILWAIFTKDTFLCRMERFDRRLRRWHEGFGGQCRY
jgi:hypothetical protein